MRYLYVPVVAVLGLLAACDADKFTYVPANDYCSFDSPVAQTKIPTSAPLETWGWAYNLAAGTVPKDVSIQLVSSKGDVVVTAPLSRSSRPDVAKAFSKPDLEMSGFAGKVDISAVASGIYTVKIIQQEGMRRFVCTSPVKLNLYSAKG